MNQKYITQLIEKLFPIAMGAVCIMIWRDIAEMKSDIKALLAQSNIDKTKIEHLERSVFSNKYKHSSLHPYNNLLFKHEEIYDIKRKIKTNIL